MPPGRRNKCLIGIQPNKDERMQLSKTERPAPFRHTDLADAMLGMVRALQFQHVGDAQSPGGRVAHFPSLDFAVIAFPRDADPVWANVLFSRDFPQGIVAEIASDAGSAGNIRYLLDQTNSAGESVAWKPDADWNALQWKSLKNQNSGHRFVSPYPASLIKLMVAVGVARVVDQSKFQWNDLWSFAGTRKSVAQWTDSMIVASNNDATSAMVALFHAAELIVCKGDGEINHLNNLFASWGLHTLRLSDTKADGGWRNADGAGVGHLHMTAWDTVRLLWLLSDEVPQAPWLTSAAQPLLTPESRSHLRHVLAEQGLHEILSSTLLAGVPGWHPGINARLPDRWIQADGSVLVEDKRFPADVRPANAGATAEFAHKTGTTDNYASDAGIVTGLVPLGRRYCIALTTSLGRRYASHPDCATDWRIPQLGAAIDAWLAARLE
jgi:beta-lactamase class A